MLVPPVPLYAEIHCRAGWVPNLLKKKEPEVVFDIPYRVDPRQPIPVLLLVKDAHNFPIRMLGVEIAARTFGTPTFREEYDLDNVAIEQPWWWHIFHLRVPEGQTGETSVLATARIGIGGKELRVVTDNYRRTSHEPLTCYLAEEPLPCPPGWAPGDLHTHSHLTNDQVEFGVPWEAAVPLARSMGLRWFGVTDHSYDLDDHPHDSLRNHADLPKWRQLWREIDSLQKQLQDFVILPGEELSAGNRRKRNVHLLILGDRNFYEGHGDSAERWMRTRPQWLVREVLEEVSEDALVAASHPGTKAPLLEWLLLRRGDWSSRDLQHPRLDGLQPLNGAFDSSFERGLKLWTDALLKGKRLTLFAGNDAHGNFARFRQIGFPFFTMRENHQQLFGVTKTIVSLRGELNRDNLLKSLKKGGVVVADGPFLEMRLRARNGAEALPGETLPAEPHSLYLRALTNPEFGYVREITVRVGEIDGEELPLRLVRNTSLSFDFETEIKLSHLPKSGYVRASLYTRQNGDHYALANPIWFGDTSKIDPR